MRHTLTIATVLIAIVIAGGAYIWSGAYDIGADAPHWPATSTVLTTLRDRSIETRSKDIRVPDLNNAQLILKGAGQYSAMCVRCHLAPGMGNSEIRRGLYPLPPDLARERIAPRVAFWVIKHGIKMSAMPAWGGSHDDATIWSMVAFLQRLPDMTPAAYKAIVAKAPPDDD